MSEITRPRVDAKGLVVACLFLLVANLVLLTVVEVQVQQRNRAVDQTQTAANVARDAANASRSQVQQVIDEQINSPQAKQNTQETRQRIINIEHALCNGPCPAAPITAPNTPPARTN